MMLLHREQTQVLLKHFDELRNGHDPVNLLSLVLW